MDARWSLCSVVVAMATVLPALPLTHAYRLSQGFHSRQPSQDAAALSDDGQDLSNISVLPPHNDDTDLATDNSAPAIDMLALQDFLKDPYWNDDSQEPYSYDALPERDTLVDNTLNMQRPLASSPLSSMLFPRLDDSSDSLTAAKRGNRWYRNRRRYNCDLRKVTLNTIMEYIRSGKICGFKVSNVRFGLGRR